MTYCVGVLLDDGLVLASDSRTGAGVDQIATFRKMAVFQNGGESIFILLSAGNLATTQAVVALIGERLEDRNGDKSIYGAHTMFEAARIVGDALREVMERDAAHVAAQNADPSASFILAGQIRGRPHRLFQIYAAGNYVEATPETPFFQIGETKYGKPILDRIVSSDMDPLRAAKCVLLSFDSTMRSNMSVGPPIDLLIYRKDSFAADRHVKITDDDPYFQELRKRFGAGIVEMFDRLPDPAWGPVPLHEPEERRTRQRGGG